MRIEQIHISAYVLDKLKWKHHVSEEEMYEVFSGNRKLNLSNVVMLKMKTFILHSAVRLQDDI